MSFFKKISDTVSKGVTSATEKAQQTVEITKLNSQISSKRKEIDKIFATIGESVYEGYLAHDLSLAESKVYPQCNEITNIRDEIAALNDRIKAIRNEKDCVCGKRLPEDTRFCSSCGHRFPDPEPEPEPVSTDESSIDVESYVTDDTASSEDAEMADVVKAHVDTRQICKSCSTPLYADSHFCPACGQSTR
ncbi:zinc ribbon domain-containing protein [Cohnella sp. WQ 127256]|uniref:zinc ribbon domain-containing protein n=1 Tax=Cohnella sp. WQ 127256 TaxID=2938790 RepID=UPI0021188596|nr:zinc ribbon domain-containing protein [Cohnella sp. WQ 127256]